MKNVRLMVMRFWKPQIVLLGGVILLALLLAKNPFSERTLIPNFEPFPDTFYYVTTPRCLLTGQGWTLCRPPSVGVSGIESSVAPLYSIALIPGFIIHNDPRFFYITNVFLAFASLGVFYSLVRRVTKRTAFLVIVLGLYVTNYYLYWLPTLAMAENLLLFLTLLALHFATNTMSNKNTFAVFLVGIGIALTKFSAVVFGFGFIGLALIKHFAQTEKTALKKQLLYLFLTVTVGLVVFHTQLFEYLQYGTNLVKSPSESSWFSFLFFPENFQFYMSALMGNQTTVLWSSLPLYSHWLAVGACIGGIFATTKRDTRNLMVFSVIPIALHVVFISFFYTADARYIFFAIPILLLLFTVFLERTREVFLKGSGEWVFNTILVIVFLIIFTTIAPRIKSQVSINLRYAETPWWYIATQEMNTFFDSYQRTQNSEGSNPTLITLMTPYFIDFYSNQKYEVLPLNSQQDFRGHKQAVWGEHVTDDLLQVYAMYLERGDALYITNYGTAGSKGFQESFEEIEKAFTLTKVQEGCHTLCNIYTVSKKTDQVE